MYQYSGLDKVTSISEGEKVISSYNYSISGQLASATTDGTTENFLWDGLALIRRGDTADKDAFFTGKPAVNNLGYSFLFRNYRADQGKWQTSDPMGYPDGWNNLAYVNNSVVCNIDYLGCEQIWAVCQRQVGADNNHTWIEGYNTDTKQTVTYSGLTPDGEKLELLKNDKADAVPAWGTEDSVQIPMPGGMTGEQFGEALENICNNYPDGTIPYGALAMGSDDYNCNSMTASILATIGVPEGIIDGIASSLPGGHWGWDTRLPAGVLRE